jgi:circadian clock protein KaiC
MISARNFIGGAGAHLVRIKMLALDHKARCLAIDPVSTLVKSAVELNAHSVAELLIDWAKAEHITMMCTSEQKETPTGSPLHISTLADTWMELTYYAQGGERNRGISIIKSRGSAHSNQVRELLLSNSGLTLSDVYSSGGEVLMGAARFEKETATRAAQEVVDLSHNLRRVRLEAEEAELLSRIRSIEAELVAKQMEKDLLDRAAKTREEETVQGGNRMQELRGADSTIMVRE